MADVLILLGMLIVAAGAIHYSVYCTVHSVQCTVYCIQYIVYSVHCNILIPPAGAIHSSTWSLAALYLEGQGTIGDSPGFIECKEMKIC